MEIAFYAALIALAVYMLCLFVLPVDANNPMTLIGGLAFYVFLIAFVEFVYLKSKSIISAVIKIPVIFIFQVLLQAISGSILHTRRNK